MHPEGPVQAGRELEQPDGVVGVRGREQIATLSRPQRRDLSKRDMSYCTSFMSPSPFHLDSALMTQLVSALNSG